MKIDINGKEADLEKSRPITLGDMRRLKAIGVDLKSLQDNALDPDQFIKFLQYLVNKANKDVTNEDIETLSFVQAGKIMEFIYSDEQIDRPT